MIVNVAVVLPAGTVTFAGTVAYEVLLLLRVTTEPPAGARPVSVTVPVEFAPPLTLVGFTVRLDRVGALTVRVAEAVPPPAIIFAVVFKETGVVVMVKVAVVAPAAAVTLLGTWATLL